VTGAAGRLLSALFTIRVWDHAGPVLVAATVLGVGVAWTFVQRYRQKGRHEKHQRLA
jgi:hypothetical protein